MNISQEIQVQYRDLGGIHVFTATELPGLHHANRDLRRAFDTLPAVVNELVKRQYGLEPCYRAKSTFDDFEHTIETLDVLPIVILESTRQPVAA